MSDANSNLLSAEPSVDERPSHDKTSLQSEKVATTNIVASTTRKQRVLDRTLWGSICLLFTVFYPVCMTVLLILMSPKPGPGGDPCGVETTRSASLLAPDRLFGNFTVTEARAIDLSWNLAMGRVVPFFMALVFFKVATVALVRIAEGTGVSYELFATVTLNLYAWQAVWPLAKGAVRTAGWKAKAAMLFMLYSALVILLMPTFMDLQTGYVRRQTAGWRLADGTILLAEDVRCEARNAVDIAVGLQTRVCFIGGSPAESVCIDGAGYQWGFSSSWFSITHFLSGFWAGGLYIIWLYASRRSTLEKSGRTMGQWRAIIDLSQAIQHDLGNNMDVASDKSLERKIEQCPPVKYDTTLDADGRLDTVTLRSVPAKHPA